ncbi:MAG TPA: hypothetical protein VFX19_00275 [Dehalococcoidia bacterium]|jgi:hypothetical protein|nr:hypothetical protein [Dehalococcoidia bacterium]
MTSRRLSAFAIACVALAATATGCTFLTVTPTGVENPVGTPHTVTATFNTFDPCAIIPELCEVPPLPVSAAIDENISFDVISGPNQGKHSDHDCDPGPACVAAPGSPISWTYIGTGGPGTDTIEVCMLTEETVDETVASMASIIEDPQDGAGMSVDEFLDAVNEELGTDYTDLQELICQQVTKTWVAPQTDNQQQRPNIGAGLSGLFAGSQAQKQPTAVVPAAQAPAISTTIRPPNTGDGGLR